MNATRGGQATHSTLTRASTSTAQNLSPAYPRRAVWGIAGSLRAWQAVALGQYLEMMSQGFLAVAIPRAGKTTFMLWVAAELFSSGDVHKMTIVCSTEHPKYQWVEVAARASIHIDPSYFNSQGTLGSCFDGVALTHAQVAANANLHRARTDQARTLVILDEIYHGRDALSWGDVIWGVFTPVRRRLALTGVPLRSDTSPAPLVRYKEDAFGAKRSQADYSYGYPDALRDRVVRSTMFMSYLGQMWWRIKVGGEIAARLGEPLTKSLGSQVWRTVLDPTGEWIPTVLAAADQRLTEVRRQVPDVGILVIVPNQAKVRAYAKQLRAIIGEAPTVVLPSDNGVSSRIEAFFASADCRPVAVRMVSEGVDIPRPAVGVYTIPTPTPLFFAQAVGRFVRSRARGGTVSVFLPSVTPLLALVGEMEVARDHVLSRPDSAAQEDALFSLEERFLAEANKTENASAELLPDPEAMDSQTEPDRMLFDGGGFGTGAMVGSVEEQEYLGLPGLLESEQVTILLRQRQDKQITSQKKQAAAEAQRRKSSGIDGAWWQVAARKELSQLVAAWARRSSQPHGIVHNELRCVCEGPEVVAASTKETERHIQTLRRWFVGKR